MKSASFFRVVGVFLCCLIIPGLAAADELQEANQLFKEGQYTKAMQHVDTYLSKNPKDAQGRFLKGLILTEENKSGEAIKVFTSLTEDYPELPEPYNNLAVLYASQGQYDKAKSELEAAIRTHPSYATAHENLGDIYAKLASQAYDKALQLDKSNAKIQTKLELIKTLFSKERNPGVAQTSQAPKKQVTEKAEKPAAEMPQKQVAAEKPEKPAAEKHSSEEAHLKKTVEKWARAWSDQDVSAYLAFYAKDFKTPRGESLEAWRALRKKRIEKPKSVEVEVSELSVSFEGEDRATVKFKQSYASSALKNVSSKVLGFKKVNGKWLIESEKVVR